MLRTPGSPKTPPANKTGEAPPRDAGRLMPLFLLLFALFLVLSSGFILLQRPVGEWSEAMRPTASRTPEPTETPRPTATPLPTATPTITPSITPVPRPAFDPARDLRSVRMMSGLVGWGSGERSLWRTSDGGSTWKDVTPAEVSAEREGMVSFFLNETAAWYLVPDGPVSAENGVLYHTGDGGQTWASIPTDFGSYATSLYFIDEKQGWVLTIGRYFSRLLLVTENGGETWSRVHVVSRQPGDQSGILPPEGSVFGPVFSSPQMGWAVGANMFSTSPVRILHSDDGGEIWLNTDYGLGSDYIIGYTSLPKFFPPDLRVGVVALQVFKTSNLERPRWIFLKSLDGGATWRIISWMDDGPAFSVGGITLVSMPTDRSFFIFVEGAMQSTNDGGQTWNQIEPRLVDQENRETALVQLSGMTFINPSNGVAWSDSGGQFRLYRTSDGGSRWEEMSYASSR